MTHRISSTRSAPFGSGPDRAPSQVARRLAVGQIEKNHTRSGHSPHDGWRDLSAVTCKAKAEATPLSFLLRHGLFAGPVFPFPPPLREGQGRG
jgi:hypothetical protein